MSDKKKIVFVCTHNAGKSRLAEAYLNKIAGDRFEGVSAGTEPSDSANPAAVEAAADVGIDLRQGPGKELTRAMTERAEIIVTFGCGVDHLGSDVQVEDWDLVDDSGQPFRDFADIRNAITKQVDELVQRLGKRSD
jgi:arsenate reductase (thioredoxin)